MRNFNEIFRKNVANNNVESQIVDFEVIVKRITNLIASQPAFTCSKLIIKTLEQGVKYVSS